MRTSLALPGIAPGIVPGGGARIRVAIPVAILFAIGLSGCSGMTRTGRWPSLAPRPGETSTLAPPATDCNCRHGAAAPVPAVPVAAAPAVAALPLPPADAAARLDAIAAAIAAVEAGIPAQRRAAEVAIAAARGQDAASNAATEAEVQRSRFEALFLPLAGPARALDVLADDLAGKTDTAALDARLAGLRARLDALDAVRSAVAGL